MRMIIILLAILASQIGNGADASRPTSLIHQRRVYAMGTWLDLRFGAIVPVSVVDRAISKLLLLEKKLSRWEPQSPIAIYNAGTIGTDFNIDPVVQQGLLAGLECSQQTQNYFKAPISINDRALLSQFALRKKTEESIDTDGYIKGLGLSQLQAEFKKNQILDYDLNFGGQIMTDTPGNVMLRHPSDRKQKILRVRHQGGSISTSSQVLDKATIRDPHSGQLALFNGSASVLDSDPLRADCLSTALIAMGHDRALRWLKENQSQKIILVTLKESASIEVNMSCSLKNQVDTQRADIAIISHCG